MKETSETFPETEGLPEDDKSESIKTSKEIVVFNVGGTKFRVMLRNFAVLPTTRLSRLIRAQNKDEILRLCDGYIYLGPPHQPEYIFNRNPSFFNAVLDLYRRRELHAPMHACSITFHEDLKYWGIDHFLLGACCILKHYSQVEACKTEIMLEKKTRLRNIQRIKDEDFGKSFIGKIRKFLWKLMEYPESSQAARVMQT